MTIKNSLMTEIEKLNNSILNMENEQREHFEHHDNIIHNMSTHREKLRIELLDHVDADTARHMTVIYKL